MYLSKIPFQANHSQVMSGFAEYRSLYPQQARSHLGILHRIELDGTTLVKSDVKPAWNFRSDVLVREYNPQVREGRFVFRLAIASIAESRGNVFPADPLVWLNKRKDKFGGFLTVKVVDKRMTHDRSSSGHVIFAPIATIEGIIEIIDCDRVREIIRDGIGKYRAYGGGLLTLA